MVITKKQITDLQAIIAFFAIKPPKMPLINTSKDHFHLKHKIKYHGLAYNHMSQEKSN